MTYRAAARPGAMLDPVLDRGFIANTDAGWFAFLAAEDRRLRAASGRGLEDVNFWVPSGRRFRAVPPGAPVFFRLKAPIRKIAGLGFFAHFSKLPAWLAWDVFGVGNGAATEAAFYGLLAKYLGRESEGQADVPIREREIGCVVLTAPSFWDEALWCEEPPDWKRQIVRGRGEDLTTPYGRSLMEAARAGWASAEVAAPDASDRPRLAEGGGAAGYLRQLAKVRVGQGAFRTLLLDAYGRACAVTREHSLPVLEAAHIRPFAETESHDPSNGILLRSDLHRLFDRGYVTVTPEHRFEVSPRLRDAWQNGRVYYELNGQKVHVPAQVRYRPDPEILRWHNDNVFLGSSRPG